MRTSAAGLAALLALGLYPATAAADPEPVPIEGVWALEASGEQLERELRLEPERLGWRYAGRTRDAAGRAVALTLRYRGHERWELAVERLVGAAGALAGDGGVRRTVPLEERWFKLRGGGFTLGVPPAPGAQPLPPAPPPGAARPVVRVLITGFDLFGYVAINPSAWAVERFDPATLDPELTRRVRIEVHRLQPVPVLWVEGAERVAREIERVDAQVAISFGVGADGGASADVERTCRNVMDGGRDNAGVTKDDVPIDPDGPEVLRSSLPVEAIVDRVEALPGLTAIDGGGGPGTYICNDTMYRVIQTQDARGELGGFIHLPSWRQSRRDGYLATVRVAIEESVKAYLARGPREPSEPSALGALASVGP